jgi:DNA-directed RNA polymerase specialized sigma24 family protein
VIHKRLRLAGPLRKLLDVSDVEQEVWEYFFVHVLGTHRFKRPQQLWAYLGQVAAHRVLVAQRRYLQSQKRDLRREQPLEATEGEVPAPLLAPMPSPEQMASARDLWQRLLRGRRLWERQALCLLRDLYTHDEVASATGVSSKAIQRLVQTLRQELAVFMS